MSRNAFSVLFQKVSPLAVSLAFLCGPMSVHAIVSMEDIHLGKPPAGFAGSFELDLGLESGNTDQTSAATGVKLQWTEKRITDFILMNYEYGETAGLTNKNKGFAHYRHIHQRDTQFAWEGFTQFSSDEFTNLRLRALIGGGVRLTLGEVNDKKAFLVGLGVFYEYEKLDTQYLDEDDTEDTLRGNAYLVMKYQFNEYVSLVSSTYYQPRLDDASDFRGIEDLSLVSQLTELTSIKVGVDIAHDSEPPRDIKKTDASLKVGIAVNF